ncbi:MAG: hypothetical protein ACUZ8E_13720, partial [Candidatus Anammoxibacter sp.]
TLDLNGEDKAEFDITTKLGTVVTTTTTLPPGVTTTTEAPVTTTTTLAPTGVLTTLTADPATVLGLAAVDITVTAKDGNGNAMEGVVIDAKMAFGFGIFVSVDPTQATTNASGVATFKVKQGFFADANNFVTFSSGSVNTTVTKASFF